LFIKFFYSDLSLFNKKRYGFTDPQAIWSRTLFIPHSGVSQYTGYSVVCDSFGRCITKV